MYALVLAALSLAASRSTVWTATLNSRQEVPKQVVKDTCCAWFVHGHTQGQQAEVEADLREADRAGDAGAHP